jgi:protein-tyrosine phosphatase
MVPGSFNFRDLGGLPVRDGVIADGLVYRSDLLHRSDAVEARSVLESLGVSRVIDLRTGGERRDDGAFPDDGVIEVVHVSVLGEVWSWDDERMADDEHFLRDRMIEMFADRGAQLVEVLCRIADSPGPVVVHCTAGKDRTGAVAAALLGVLGAEPTVIADDYARSADAMPAMVEWYRAQATEAEMLATGDDHSATLGRAALPATIAGLCDHVIGRHGSFAAWGRTSGLPDTDVERLRERLVVPPA